MNDEAQQVRREYQKHWRQQNPEKVREYQKRYWERKAQQSTLPTAMPVKTREGDL